MPLTLSIREWTCKNGHKLDCDLNASQNIFKEGLKIYREELAITKVERKSDFGNKAHSMKPEAHPSPLACVGSSQYKLRMDNIIHFICNCFLDKYKKDFNNMGYFVLRKSKKVNEEGTEDSAENSSQSTSKESIPLLQQITEIEKQKSDAKFQYDSKVKQLNDQILVIKQKLSAIGATSPTISESKKILNSIQLFEAEVNSVKQKELSSLIEDAYKNINDISYIIDTNGCNKLARKITEFVNIGDFEGENGHWDDIVSCIKRYFANGVVNYTDKEFDIVINAIKDVLTVTDNSFEWMIK